MAPVLTSERLIFEPLSMKHLSLRYVNWLNDPDVNKYLESGGDYTLDKLEAFLKKVEGTEIFFWAVHLKDNHMHIGNIKIDPVDEKQGRGQYGIMFGEKTEWGKGYAKEASLKIFDYCFQELKLRKIYLGVVEENTRAVELYKKMGFQIEGINKKHGLYNGHYCNSIIMALFNPNIIY